MSSDGRAADALAAIQAICQSARGGNEGPTVGHLQELLAALERGPETILLQRSAGAWWISGRWAASVPGAEQGIIGPWAGDTIPAALAALVAGLHLDPDRPAG